MDKYIESSLKKHGYAVHVPGVWHKMTIDEDGCIAERVIRDRQIGEYDDELSGYVIKPNLIGFIHYLAADNRPRRVEFADSVEEMEWLMDTVSHRLTDEEA